MRLFVLDSDILTLYSRNHPLVTQRIDARSRHELAVTVISVEEQVSGWLSYVHRAKRPDQVARGYLELADTVRFLAGWNILLFTEPIINRVKQLVTLKLSVGKMDLKIAAIALENGATMVTRNLRDFQRVPGLVVENWAA